MRPNHLYHLLIGEDVPSDLVEHYQYATEFLTSYMNVFECLATEYTYGGEYCAPSEEVLGGLIDSWNSVSALMDWYEMQLFPIAFLNEVLAVRKEYTGVFIPEVFIPETLSGAGNENTFACVSYNSAFHYVQELSTDCLCCARMSGNDSILKKLIPSKKDGRLRIVELQPRPLSGIEQYDLVFAYFIGSLENLKYVSHPKFLSGELRREIQAVSRRRSSGRSSQAIGDSSSPDLVMTQDEVQKKIEQGGGVKKAILYGLLEHGAVGSDNSVSAPILAQRIGMECDSTCKSHLSWLRDLRLVGGEKGQRGYWIDEPTRDVLMQIKDRVGDQVRN